MSCEAYREQIDEWLDGELSPSAADALRRHLKECPACQTALAEAETLDGLLSTHLPPKDLDFAAERLRQELERTLELKGRPIEPITVEPTLQRASNTRVSREVVSIATRAVQRRSFLLRLATVASIVLCLLAGWWAFRPFPLGNHGNALTSADSLQLTRATGRVEWSRLEPVQWQELASHKQDLPRDGAQVRTADGVSCELRLSERTLLRMAPSTQIAVRPHQQLDLLRGKLWVRTADQPVEIAFVSRSTPSRTQDDGEPNKTTTPDWTWMRCPSEATFQCEATPDAGVVQAIDAVKLQDGRGTTSCSLNPQDKLVTSLDRPQEHPLVTRVPDDTPFSHPAYAWYWQLPLLALDANDPDLFALIVKMLPEESVLNTKAAIGATKLDYLYDQEIRLLGPRAALPLLAFVRREESKQTPARRLRAMRLACELADITAEMRLAPLVEDNQPEIAELARRTMHRIDNRK